MLNEVTEKLRIEEMLDDLRRIVMIAYRITDMQVSDFADSMSGSHRQRTIDRQVDVTCHEGRTAPSFSERIKLVFCAVRQPGRDLAGHATSGIEESQNKLG